MLENVPGKYLLLSPIKVLLGRVALVFIKDTCLDIFTTPTF